MQKGKFHIRTQFGDSTGMNKRKEKEKKKDWKILRCIALGDFERKINPLKMENGL